jgi:hypothetical protein
MDDFDRVQAYAPMLQIAHHIPGRIRLKLCGANDKIKSLAAYAKRFDDLWRDIPGIRSARLNLVARSCTVEYDDALIPFRAWPDLLGGARSDEALKLLGILKQKFETLR